MLPATVFLALFVFFEFCLGLAAALMFSLLGNASRIFRTVFLYPLMIAPVVAGLLWRFLLIDSFGIINELLDRAGLLSSSGDIPWLSDPDIALFSVAIPDIWLTTSFMTLVLFAGLQNIPGDVIEAARIDGARNLTILFRIIIPLLRPVIAVALIIRGVDAARAFDVILIQTNGGPQQSTEVMSMLIYRTMVRFGDPGLASAMGTLYLIAMMVIASIAVIASFINGAVTALLSTLISLLLALPAAYAVTRFRTRYGRVFIVLALVMRMVPPIAVGVPMVQVFQSIGLYDTSLALALAHVTISLPLSIWLMASFFESVPVELEEAAKIDGASRLGALWRVVLPVTSGGIAVTAIFAFLASWNEFLFSLLLTAFRSQTTPIVIANFQTQFGLDWGAMTALAILYSVPVILLTFMLQKHIVAGMTLGAVKG
ncbi:MULTISPECIES: ABC transporter permease subunit [unclassified Actinomyces]|uniref:ABC transporter permease n=1 Tax=unclassified Actinomyces TaxID=2609248 RepID=UPI0020182E2A|nr:MULTISPECIES: ABC transporter permease subunit [unclassified Actinomyces]